MTNRVRANAHLGDRVIFYDDARDLQEKLRELDDEVRYRRVCEQTRERALASNNIYALLTALVRDLG